MLPSSCAEALALEILAVKERVLGDSVGIGAHAGVLDPTIANLASFREMHATCSASLAKKTPLANFWDEVLELCAKAK